ncbi:hypothetical protein GGF38_006235, partial [Coemansia sp. RSA 25]
TDIWAFSLAFDASTHLHRSYLDVRVRLHVVGLLENIHILALPIHGQHSGKHICDSVAQLLQSLCPNWRYKLLGISTDGAANMQGIDNGAVPHLARLAKNTVVHAWCGIHQLNLIAEKSLKAVLGGEFFHLVEHNTKHLRQQYSLIDKMGSSCPRFATRWLDMGRYCVWHLANVAAINKHFDGSHGSNPCLPWYFWPLIAVVHKIIKEFEKTVKVLQGQTVTLSDQELQIEALIATLKRETGL